LSQLAMDIFVERIRLINADENAHHGQQSQKQKSHWAVGR